jgi:ribosome-associated heat shock protein Hsp15
VGFLKSTGILLKIFISKLYKQYNAMEKLRIDKYLWAIRVFKTRSQAADACDAGRVKLNGSSVKASKTVSIGDTYDIRTSVRDWKIVVTGLLESRKAYSEAIKYYDDITPEEEKNVKEKMTASFYTGKRLSKTGKPTKKQRRDMEDLL